MRRACPVLALMALTGVGCCPSRSEQTGPPVVFAGVVERGGIAVHDFAPPANTTQSDVTLSWTSGNLRFSEILPTCPPGQELQCVRLTDPIGTEGNSTRELRLIVANQRPENRRQMKFLRGVHVRVRGVREVRGFVRFGGS